MLTRMPNLTLDLVPPWSYSKKEEERRRSSSKAVCTTSRKFPTFIEVGEHIYALRTIKVGSGVLKSLSFSISPPSLPPPTINLYVYTIIYSWIVHLPR